MIDHKGKSDCNLLFLHRQKRKYYNSPVRREARPAGFLGIGTTTSITQEKKKKR
jgi:hypothetical protein